MHRPSCGSSWSPRSGRLRSPEDAAEWVRQRLPEKSRLRASDAAQVESVFEAKLEQITAFRAAGATTQAANAVQQPASPTSEVDLQSDELRGPFRQGAIDKGVLALPEPRRNSRPRSRQVGRNPSLPGVRSNFLRILIICALPRDRALSCKVSDEFTVPFCRGHHRELHRYGDEAIWWSRLGIDALQVARALWLESHPAPDNVRSHRREFLIPALSWPFRLIRRNDNPENGQGRRQIGGRERAHLRR